MTFKRPVEYTEGGAKMAGMYRDLPADDLQSQQAERYAKTPAATDDDKSVMYGWDKGVDDRSATVEFELKHYGAGSITIQAGREGGSADE